ncbi:hypothetical protein QTN25_007508 [Entamoeba marina]
MNPSYTFLLEIASPNNNNEFIAVTPNTTIEEIIERCFPLEYTRGDSITVCSPVRLLANIERVPHNKPRQLRYQQHQLEEVHNSVKSEMQLRELQEEEERSYLESVDDWYFDQKHKKPPKRHSHQSDYEKAEEVINECLSEICTGTLIMVVIGWLLILLISWRFFFPEGWSTWGTSILQDRKECETKLDGVK